MFVTYFQNTHEVASCTVNQTQTVENCVPATGVTTCYQLYDTGNEPTTTHSDGSSTGAYCSDWGQCEGNPNHDALDNRVGLGSAAIGAAHTQQSQIL